MAQQGNDLSGNYLGNARPVMNKADQDNISSEDFAKFQNVGTMKEALLEEGYTAAQLNIMTKNDLNYALRGKLGLR